MTKAEFIVNNYEKIVQTILANITEFLFELSGQHVSDLQFDQQWHSINKHDGYVGIYEENKTPNIIVTYHSFKGGEKATFNSRNVIDKIYEQYLSDGNWEKSFDGELSADYSKQQIEIQHKYREFSRIAAINEWRMMHRSPLSHPYLASKKLLWDSSLRHGGDRFGYYLAALITDASGEKSVGWQKVYPRGFKAFNAGLAKKGSCIRVGHLEEGAAIYLVEGLADALTVNQCLGAFAVAYLDIGNVDEVTRSIQDIYSENPKYFVADNDKKRVNSITKKPENIGVLKSFSAMASIKGAEVKHIIPDVPELDKIDINDYYVRYGSVAVKNLVSSAKPFRVKEFNL